ncbi:MAG: hypothetical protein HY329_00945 [Chloroflexi bacterium]|nr:hypothetical protein [Chloroflexota bacterium]
MRAETDQVRRQRLPPRFGFGGSLFLNRLAGLIDFGAGVALLRRMSAFALLGIGRHPFGTAVSVEMALVVGPISH